MVVYRLDITLNDGRRQLQPADSSGRFRGVFGLGFRWYGIVVIPVSRNYQRFTTYGFDLLGKPSYGYAEDTAYGLRLTTYDLRLITQDP